MMGLREHIYRLDSFCRKTFLMKQFKIPHHGDRIARNIDKFKVSLFFYFTKERNYAFVKSISRRINNDKSKSFYFVLEYVMGSKLFLRRICYEENLVF